MRYLWLLLCFSVFIFADNITLESFNKLKAIKEKKIEVIEFKEYDSLYILKGKKQTKRGDLPILFYVTKDLKYVFIGRAYSSDTNEPVFIQSDMNKYKKYANFTFGEGKDEYFLFTDPECPYCKKFEKILFEIDSQKDIRKKIKIYYFLFPLDFHKEAIPMSNYILSQKDRYKALKKIVIDGSKEYKSFSNKKSKELIKNADIGFEVIVRGTPFLMDKNGKRLRYKLFLDNLK